MVLFFTSQSAGADDVTLYMGRDKVENEDLIKHAWNEDVWFHVDKLSSAHVYLRLPYGMEWDAIPAATLEDCAQLVKANSIEGNKRKDITIIYTPASNLKKQGDMAVGSVAFHNNKLVRRTHVAERINAIVNRLNKTKEERKVDFEQEKRERIKQETKKRLQIQKQNEAEYAKIRQQKKVGYADLVDNEEDEWERKQAVGDFDPDEDFM